METKDKKIVFLGDSITVAFRVSSKDARFSEIVSKELGASAMVNYGICGNRIARQFGKNEYGPSFSERYVDMDADADIVVVLGGTNDYGHGDAPFGEEGDFTTDTFCGACNYLCAGLIKKYPTARIFIMTPLHRQDEKVPNSKGKVLEDYVNVIRRSAENYSIPVIDLWKIAGIQPDIEESRAAYMPDGLHPNDAGHRLIADRIVSFIKNY